MGKLKALIIIIGTLFLVSAGAVGTYFGFMAAGVISLEKREVTMQIEDVEASYDGKEHKATTATVVEGNIVEGDTYELVATSSAVDVGAVTATGKVYFYDKNGNDITSKYKCTVKPGEINITKRKLNITLASASKVYDGTPLSSTDFEADNLVPGEHIVPTFTTSVTFVTDKAKARLTATIVNQLGTDVSANYDIKYTNSDADLEITRRPLEIKTFNANKVFDGTALTNSDVEIKGLIDDDILDPKDIKTTELKYVGTIENDVVNANQLQIVNTNGDDVTANYQILVQSMGKLEVTKRDLIVYTPDYEVEYSGSNQKYSYKSTDFEKLFDEADLELIETAGLLRNMQAEITEDTACTQHKKVGEYKNDVTFNFGNAGKNFNIKYVKGNFKIKKITLDLNVKLAKTSRTYDGKELEGKDIYDLSTASKEFLTDNGITLTYQNVNQILNVGTYVTSLIYSFKTEDTSDENLFNSIELNYEPLEITITPIELDIQMKNMKNAYDGTARSNFEFGYDNYEFKNGSGKLVDGDSLKIVFKTSSGDAIKNVNTYTLKYSNILINNQETSNYKLKTELGNTPYEIEKAKVTLKLETEKIYDGIALTYDKDHYLVTAGTIYPGDDLLVSYKSDLTVKEVNVYQLTQLKSSLDNYELSFTNAPSNSIQYKISSPNIKCVLQNNALGNKYTGDNLLDSSKIACKITDEAGNDITSQFQPTKLNIAYQALNTNGELSQSIYEVGNYTISVAKVIYDEKPLTVVDGGKIELSVGTKDATFTIINQHSDTAKAMTYSGAYYSLPNPTFGSLGTGDVVNVISNDKFDYGDTKESGNYYYSVANIKFSIVDSNGNNKTKNYNITNSNAEVSNGVISYQEKIYFKPAELTVEVNKTSQVYDGKKYPTITLADDDFESVNGLVGGDTLQLVCTSANMKEVGAYNLMLSKLLINNAPTTKYTIDNFIQGYEITAASVSLKLNTEKIYDGEELTKFDHTLYGVTSGTIYTGDEVEVKFSCIDQVVNVGYYNLTDFKTENKNYKLSISNANAGNLTFEVKSPAVKFTLSNDGLGNEYNGSNLLDSNLISFAVTDASDNPLALDMTKLSVAYEALNTNSGETSKTIFDAGQYSIYVASATYDGAPVTILNGGSLPLIVATKEVTLNILNAHATYSAAITFDGQAHSSEGATVTGLVTGDSVDFISKESIDFYTKSYKDDANKYYEPLTGVFRIVDSYGKNNTTNYSFGSIQVVDGTVTITANVYFKPLHVEYVYGSTFVVSQTNVDDQMPFDADEPNSMYTLSTALPNGYSVQVYYKEIDFSTYDDGAGKTIKGTYALEIDDCDVYYLGNKVNDKIIIDDYVDGSIVVI